MSKWKFVFVAPPPPPRCGSGCDGRVAVSRSRSDSRAGVCCSAVIARVAVGASGSVLEGVVFTAGQYALLERLDPRLPGLRHGTELVLRDGRWHVDFGTRCLLDAGADEDAIPAQGERAAAVWAP